MQTCVSCKCPTVSEGGWRVEGERHGTKKIIFTACHSGKLKLAFTSPDVISTNPKNFLTFCLAELISQFFCYSNSSKTITCLSGKLKTEFTSPIAKSTRRGLSDTIFVARWEKKWLYCYATWFKKTEIYVPLSGLILSHIRAVYTRENKPQLTIAAAYIRCEHPV